MKKALLVEKVAMASAMIALAPIAITLTWLCLPRDSFASYKTANLGIALLSVWPWIWAPTYALAKGLFLWRSAKNDRESVRRSLWWLVATDVELILLVACSTVIHK